MRFKYKGSEIEIRPEVIGLGYTIVIDRKIFRHKGTEKDAIRFAKQWIDSGLDIRF